MWSGQEQFTQMHTHKQQIYPPADSTVLALESFEEAWEENNGAVILSFTGNEGGWKGEVGDFVEKPGEWAVLHDSLRAEKGNDVEREQNKL